MNSCRIQGALGLVLTLMLPVGGAPITAQIQRSADFQAPSLADVLDIAVNRKPIATTSDLPQALRSARGKIALDLMRDSTRFFLAIG